MLLFCAAGCTCQVSTLGSSSAELVAWCRASPPACHLQMCSKRAFEGQVKKWRRQLHAWDPPEVRAPRVAAQLPIPAPAPCCSFPCTATLPSHLTLRACLPRRPRRTAASRRCCRCTRMWAALPATRRRRPASPQTTLNTSRTQVGGGSRGFVVAGQLAEHCGQGSWLARLTIA